MRSALYARIHPQRPGSRNVAPRAANARLLGLNRCHLLCPLLLRITLLKHRPAFGSTPQNTLAVPQRRYSQSRRATRPGCMTIGGNDMSGPE
jgi:hypothetical protein